MAVTRSTEAKARREWMRIGRPLRARNCLGWGPAMRVPKPAAGRITKTCITGEVYNHLLWGRRGFAAILAWVGFNNLASLRRKKSQGHYGRAKRAQSYSGASRIS